MLTERVVRLSSAGCDEKDSLAAAAARAARRATAAAGGARRGRRHTYATDDATRTRERGGAHTRASVRSVSEGARRASPLRPPPLAHAQAVARVLPRARPPFLFLSLSRLVSLPMRGARACVRGGRGDRRGVRAALNKQIEDQCFDRTHCNESAVSMICAAVICPCERTPLVRISGTFSRLGLAHSAVTLLQRCT
jgi:hypothetical protein